MLEVRLLRTLAEVARRGSLSAAAKSLSFTPSAVSQQIAALERATGARLLERGARGVRLTEAGSALTAHAELVLAQLADAESQLAALAGVRGGRLRFGCFPTATVAFGAALGENFRTLHPEVDFGFVDIEPYESVSRLVARELDLAIVFAYDRWPITSDYDGVSRASDHGVEYVELFDDPLFLVLPRGHELGRCGAVALEQLEHEQILGCEPWGSDLRHVCRGVGFEPTFDTSYRSSDFNTFQAFVAAGRGLTLIPGLALTVLRDDVIVRPFEHALARHVMVATPAKAYRSPATAAMLELLLDRAESLQNSHERLVEHLVGV